MSQVQRNYDSFDTPLGILHCLIENDKVAILHPYISPSPICKDPLPLHPLLGECKAQIEAYFKGRLKQFSLPLLLNGTSFIQNTLHALQNLRFGETVSYAELATLAGYPKAYRAIGSALARNPILLLLPCHRVTRSDFKLGKYVWGDEKKEWLLRLEGAI